MVILKQLTKQHQIEFEDLCKGLMFKKCATIYILNSIVSLNIIKIYIIKLTSVTLQAEQEEIQDVEQ